MALGVNKALEAKENKMSDQELDAIGAGDQGMMFGFATNETEEFMPYPISLAHKLAKRLTEVRKNGTLKYLRPDGKSQVTVEYDENDKPVRLDAVVLSTQHDESVTQEQIHADVKKYIFDEILPQNMIDGNTKFFINPTGRFVIGGPQGVRGLTGLLHILPAMLLRTSWRPVWLTSARFSCPMPLVLLTPPPLWWIPTEPVN